jgi:hypothetical protein
MITVSDGVLIAVIVQIGLTVRQYLANRIKARKEKKEALEKAKIVEKEKAIKDKEEKDYKQDVMSQLNKLNKFRESEDRKTLILDKEFIRYREKDILNEKRYDKLSKSLEYITEYVDQAGKAKGFKYKMNKYSKKILDITKKQNILELNQFRKCFSELTSGLLKCGFNHLDYDTILDDLLDEGIEEEKAKIFIVDIHDIIKNNKNTVRVNKYLSYCKKFIKKIIEDYKVLEKS